jgi:hypothetical protein
MDSLSALQLSMEETTKAEQLYQEYLAFQRRKASFVDVVESLRPLISHISEAGSRFFLPLAKRHRFLYNIGIPQQEVFP